MRRPHNLLGLDFRFLNNFKTVISILKQSSICLVQVQRRNLDTSSMELIQKILKLRMFVESDCIYIIGDNNTCQFDIM